MDDLNVLGRDARGGIPSTRIGGPTRTLANPFRQTEPSPSGASLSPELPFASHGISICEIPAGRHNTDVADTVPDDFETLDRAMFIVDAGRGVRRANALARAMIATGYVVRGADGRLIPGDRETSRQFDEGLRIIIHGRSQTYRFHRAIGDGHWLIFDMRCLGEQAGCNEIMVKVRATSDDAPRGAWTATVRSLRFSPAEADVAFCIFSAMSAKEIALELDVSPNTVKSHLRSIYAKCGCGGYSETLRLLLSLTRP